MKITAFGVSQEERLIFEKWAQTHPEVELRLVTEWLTATNVTLAAGSIGVSAFQTGQYDAALFEKMAALALPVLAIRNVGTDNIDFAAAARYKIQISNVPSYSPAGIAEYVVTLALQLLRRMPEVERLVATDQLLAARALTGRELSQQTVGVVGFGHIGQLTAKLFHQMGARVLAFDAYYHGAEPTWLRLLPDLPSLLAESNLVTLHVPGVAANRYLLNATNLALLPEQALVINTARGNLIETPALIAALRSGALAGAAIDTFELEDQIEPAVQQRQPISDPLYRELSALPNVLVTPHIAYHTNVAVVNMVQDSLANLLAYACNGQLQTPVTR
ncbi:NAD(P)-dependent oxidoreductase [Lapidilactobacillus luobeiensis]|uniref:NAD(P)-dependent oxidoreductase n=1 Tax=Lapidilactobacillus luobeiensis TaxID=2950371 RepID=UPI0021C31584|nr:NAD(P)-dependent oxidoreductase [Lapidilactobacillus luobeiensis]